MGGEAAPVIAGLAAGVALLLVFSNFPVFLSTQDTAESEIFVVLKLKNLDDTYPAGERISFTLVTAGASRGLCNYPKPSVGIVNMESEKGIWYTPPTFQTAMLCPLQPFHAEWRFGYSGEELPFQSALVPDSKYENRIVIEEPGRYKVVARFQDHMMEKEFTILP